MQTLIHVVYSCMTYKQRLLFILNLWYANLMTVLKVDGVSKSATV